jgi:hypothetical protein
MTGLVTPCLSNFPINKSSGKHLAAHFKMSRQLITFLSVNTPEHPIFGFLNKCQLLSICQREKMSCFAVASWLKRSKEQVNQKEFSEKKEMPQNNSMLSLENLPKQDLFKKICSWLEKRYDDNSNDFETNDMDDDHSDVSNEEFKHIFQIKRRSLRGMHPIKIQEEYHQNRVFIQQLDDSQFYGKKQLKSLIQGISTCV